jgi:hypothetical protein
VLVTLLEFYQTVRVRWAVQAAREDVPAVDTAGLAALMNKARMRRKFERGELKCKFCRSAVTEESLYALMRESGTVKPVCAKPECVAAFVEWIEAR